MTRRAGAVRAREGEVGIQEHSLGEEAWLQILKDGEGELLDQIQDTPLDVNFR